MTGYRAAMMVSVLWAVAMLSGCGDPLPAPDRTPLMPAERLRETDVLPHADGRIRPDRNYVYCATFQLAWDDLRQQVGAPNMLLDGKPPLAESLNKNPFDRAQLADASYLAMAGRTDRGIVPAIRQAMAAKFPTATLDVPDPPQGTAVYVYSYLAKSSSFAEAFDRLPRPMGFRYGKETAKVTAFGIDSERSAGRHLFDLLPQVAILDYRDDDDFIISLKGESADEQLILAKTAPKATLRKTVAYVEDRIASSDGEELTRKLQLGELFHVPVIATHVTRRYDELRRRKILNEGWDRYWIEDARQDIRFKLDERGAKLESSTRIAVSAAKPLKVRSFVVDKPFLLYMKQVNAKTPYFALWVGTPELLVTVGEDGKPVDQKRP